MRAHTGDWLIVKGRTDSSAAGGPWFSKRMDPNGSAPFWSAGSTAATRRCFSRDRMRSSSPQPNRQSKIAPRAAASISFNPHWKKTGTIPRHAGSNERHCEEPS